QRGQDPTVHLAKEVLDGCFGRPSGSPHRRPDYCCQRGRISIEPFWAWGILAAQLIASSRSLHSNTQKPPSCSWVSAKGPSVVSVLPSRTRTVVAVEVGCRPSLAFMTPARPISSLKAA